MSRPITFLQTCDPQKYAEMLFATSRTVRRYCELHGHRYRAFIGLKRGHLPWHATYNRIGMLEELLNEGYDGWVAYLDADAYIAELQFDLRAYLADKEPFGAVLYHTGAEDSPWFDVNAGIFYLNLGNPGGVDLARRWIRRLASVTDAQFASAIEWGATIEDDQFMLQNIFKENLELRATVHLAEERLRGFAQQHLRAADDNFERRCATLVARVQSVMGDPPAAPAAPPENAHFGPVETDTIVESIYQALLGRPADADGRRAYTEHLLGSPVDDSSTLIGIMKSFVESEEFRVRVGMGPR